jgi:hypothetical protein
MRIIYNAEQTAVSYEWDSFDEWFDEFKVWRLTEEGKRLTGRHAYDFSGSASIKWFGRSDGFNGTLHAIDSGWAEKREQLTKVVEGLELELPVFPSMTNVRRRKRRWTEDGDDFSQERAWSGQLDTCWSKPVRTERLQPNTKRVTLAFDVTDNAGVSDADTIWRAALSLLLCDSLVRAGRTFEVWCMDSTNYPFEAGSGAPTMMWTGWMVKGSHEPLVMDRMAGMLGIGFLRTAGFMGQCMGPHLPARGLGSAAHRGLPATLAERRANGEVVIRIAGCYSKADALARYSEAWQEVEAAAAASEAA